MERKGKRLLVGAFGEAGSLALEALLVLPIALLLFLFALGLVQTAQAALAVDYALGRTVDGLAKQAYALEQLLRPVEGAMTDMAVQAAASLIAGRLFDQALEERSGAFGSLRQGRLKASVEIEARLDFERGWLRLSLRLAPAGISPGAALLPGDWLPCFERSRELWLTGRNLLPGRGLERSFGGIKKGPAVYITRWGVCYHQWGCRYLAKSRIAADLSRLSEAYRPCEVCRPPSRSGQGSEHVLAVKPPYGDDGKDQR